MGMLTEPWTCPTCRGTVRTPFCPACGESPPSARDLTLAGLFHQLIQAVSAVDGRLLRSFRHLVTRPGALTVAYVQGRRLAYLGPFQLFLVANVLFFAMQSLTDTNVVSSTLDSHLHRQDWGPVAERLLARRLEAMHTTVELYAPVFDQAVVFYAKSLIILMILPFVAVLALLFHRTRQPFGAHVVFALHFHAFLLLLFCAWLLVAGLNVAAGGAGLNAAPMDNALTLANLGACATYLFIATGRVYGGSGALRALKALTLAVAVGGIVLGYRFSVFLITLYVT